MKFTAIFIWLTLAVCYNSSIAQPNTTIDLYNEKPKLYQNRSLRSEKTTEGKLPKVGKVFQNAFSHFNYYFNANNKYNEIVDKAKSYFRDDYTELLPFYNYTFQATASSKNDIDSIIYKCTSGILLHDLRSDWVDNLYLLVGKAYMLRQNFDSAGFVFQFINHAWAPSDEGYILTLGSNSSNTNGIFTIASKEKTGFFSKLSNATFSRNEALLWMARNYLEQEKYAQASSLMAMLNNDVFFPERLITTLHELWAYNYYKQQVNDSAAYYLQKALPNAANKKEKARWLYLCGQLWHKAKQDSLAIVAYEKSIATTPDPLLEVYARLNIVQLASAKKTNALQENLSELYKMAKRDKYENYKDIILLAAAKLELLQNNFDGANKAAIKSIKNNIDNPDTKNNAFLFLANLHYQKGNYQEAYNYYDSITTNGLSPATAEWIADRKPSLKKVAANLTTIYKEDSLQKLALLTESERNAAVKKVLKQLRKEKGLKEQENMIDFGSNNLAQGNNANGNFGSSSSDFYFNNTALKQRGNAEFKARWGSRPNVDNWRRQSAINTTSSNPFAFKDIDDITLPNKAANAEDKDKDKPEVELSFEGLMSHIPLTTEQKTKSDSLISKALYDNGLIFQTELRNILPAVAAYEQLLKRYRESAWNDAAMYNLIFCYKQINEPSKANQLADILKEGYSKSKYTLMLNNISENNQADILNTYNKIFGYFEKNEWEKARILKDSLENKYGKNSTTPQLLYLEALQLAKQRKDSLATVNLYKIIGNFPESPLVEKAKNMLYVLSQRDQIELHLTYSTEEKMEDDDDFKKLSLSETETQLNDKPILKAATITTKSSNLAANLPTIKPTENIAPKMIEQYSFDAQKTQFVAVSFKVADDVMNEVKNAFNRYNKIKFADKNLALTTYTIDADHQFLLIGEFENAADAVDYLDKAKLQASFSIIPWIQPTSRYKFWIISSDNLKILKERKDINVYETFIKGILPDKF